MLLLSLLNRAAQNCRQVSPVVLLLISVLEIAFLMYKRFFVALVVYGQVFWPFHLFPVVEYIASGDVSQKGTLLVLMKQLRSK